MNIEYALAQTSQPSFVPDWIWTHPGWTIVGTIATVVLAFVFAPKRRHFACTRVTNQRLQAGLPSELVKVLFGSTEIPGACLWQLNFENVGWPDIPKSDWEQPLTISFGEGTAIVWAGANREKKTPKNFEVVIEIRDGKLVVHPGLMHKGDSFGLSLMVRGEGIQQLEMESRVVGVREIDPNYTKRSFNEWYREVGPILIYGWLWSGLISAANLMAHLDAMTLWQVRLNAVIFVSAAWLAWIVNIVNWVTVLGPSVWRVLSRLFKRPRS